MKSVRLAILLCSAGTLVLPALAAQPGKGVARPTPRYDPAAETIVSGTILDVQQYQRGRVPGMPLIVKSEAETLDVHLGPSTYISSQGFAFAKGGTIELLGSKTSFGAQQASLHAK